MDDLTIYGSSFDAFIAYHHNKEIPVVAILADLYDTFDRRCEKNGTRIVCCMPTLYVWLVSHLFAKKVGPLVHCKVTTYAPRRERQTGSNSWLVW